MLNIVDNKEVYIKLFKYIKEHKWDIFLDNIKKFDFNYDINIRDDQYNYFITYACLFNKKNIVIELLNKGARIDIVDLEDKSLLYIPIKYGYNDILEILLKENSNNIGVSIIDIKDKTYKISLHYAIILKNIDAIKLLLEYNSNPNISDINGYNSLHYSIKSRSFDVCKIIVDVINNLNAKCNTGETALHIACNFQLFDICELLVKKGANINIQDYEHEFSALHYTTTLDNKPLTKLLLDNNADPNLQDIYGNTPIHYSIIEENYEIIEILIDKKLNLNLWNIDGKIPLHMILENYTSNFNQYLPKFIEKSNLTIQNNEGNNILFYLIKLDIWKEHRDILVKKKLDIFSSNKDGKRCIDIIESKDYNLFIDTITESYYYRLINAKKEWTNEWEKICSMEFKEEDKKIIQDYFKEPIANSDDLKKTCSKRIKIRLHELSKNNICSNTSYPSNKNRMCIKISEGDALSVCTFTGNTLDILLGLLYILKKYKDTCSTLSYDFVENKELCNFYRSIGIIMNSKCEFLNFEIVWVNYKLYLIDGFFDKIRDCIKSGKKFIIIPLGIDLKAGAHANYLIYDIKNNSVERFEPHGSTIPPGLQYNPNLLDEILESRFKIIDENIKYYRPKDFLPKIGFQLMDIYENRRKIGDPGGFCAVWALWYVDMRLTYRDLTNKELVKVLIRSLRTQNISVKNMIRNYAKNCIEIRDKILSRAGLDINDWINGDYTDDQITKVVSELKANIANL